MSPSTPKSVTVTMFGCESAARALASRSKRCFRTGMLSYCASRTLSATARPRVS